MAGQEYQVPDLASVLRTLASFAPPAQEASSHSRPHTTETRPASEAIGSKVPEATGPPPVPANGPKIIDPATIIDWSSGLRCVMKTVAAHDNIIKEIRRIIKVQHEHEDQWWAGRRDLLRRQATRKESKKRLDEVLASSLILGRRAVGGNVADRPADEEDLAEELRIFDGKVYRAQVQMVKELSAKLKGLGVPFFGTRGELVRRKGETNEGTSGKGDGKGEGKDDKRIEEADLVELQRRMIGILEDLCCE